MQTPTLPMATKPAAIARTSTKTRARSQGTITPQPPKAGVRSGTAVTPRSNATRVELHDLNTLYKDPHAV